MLRRSLAAWLPSTSDDERSGMHQLPASAAALEAALLATAARRHSTHAGQLPAASCGSGAHRGAYIPLVTVSADGFPSPLPPDDVALAVSQPRQQRVIMSGH